MKTCKKCNIEKEMTLFKKVKDSKDGHSNSCKECDAIANREYKEKNKDKVAEKKKEWREKNKDHISKMDKIWREENKEHLQEYRDKNKESIKVNSKEYYEKNKEYYKKYREENKESIKEYYKEYSDENKESIKEYHKEYRDKNKESIKEYHKVYHNKNRLKINERIKNRLKNDTLFKLSNNIRTLIQVSFKNSGYSKKTKTHEILGCSFEEFELHLESQFEDWMTWDNKALYNGELNYGWDIDHKIPLASAETEEDIIRLNHYTNLQPLCSYTNRHIKSDRLDYNK